MAIEEQLAVLKQGVETWNKWRDDHPDLKVDLRGADLSRTNLNGIDFRDARLTRVDLRGASLQGAHLARANLSRAT
jgi:uncharacterized protein YjbI with pentapeptide repeats